MGSLEPRAPFVRVYVPAAVQQLSQQLWPISGNSEAAAWFHSTDANPEIASTGYMIVSSVGSDNTIEGSVHLRFPDAGNIDVGFRATWITGTFLCA